MTQQEHLQRIRRRCVELLEIAEKRKAWAWESSPAEAGWKATIAAVDEVTKYGFEEGAFASFIIAAWPEELL